jgi:Ca2+-binding RTX toxin-like protein
LPPYLLDTEQAIAARGGGLSHSSCAPLKEKGRMMKKTVVLLAAMAVAVVVASGVALAATSIGTANDEILTGTNQADTIRARGGDDVVLGREGADRLRGGNGEDSLYGGRGADFLYSEDIFSQSGAYRDLVDCGPGDDTASVDFRDRVVDCEEVGVAIP